MEKVADTDLAASMVTVHVDAVPLQAPPHCLKVAPTAGVAVRRIGLPLM